MNMNVIFTIVENKVIDVNIVFWFTKNTTNLLNVFIISYKNTIISQFSAIHTVYEDIRLEKLEF